MISCSTCSHRLKLKGSSARNRWQTWSARTTVNGAGGPLGGVDPQSVGYLGVRIARWQRSMTGRTARWPAPPMARWIDASACGQEQRGKSGESAMLLAVNTGRATLDERGGNRSAGGAGRRLRRCQAGVALTSYHGTAP